MALKPINSQYTNTDNIIGARKEDGKYYAVFKGGIQIDIPQSEYATLSAYFDKVKTNQYVNKDTIYKTYPLGGKYYLEFTNGSKIEISQQDYNNIISDSGEAPIDPQSLADSISTSIGIAGDITQGGDKYDIHLDLTGSAPGKTIKVNADGDDVEWGDAGIDNYNELTNKPILNQDLGAAGFTPTLGAYYRHTGTGGGGGPTGTAIAVGDNFNSIYLNLSMSDNAIKTYLSGLSYEGLFHKFAICTWNEVDFSMMAMYSNGKYSLAAITYENIIWDEDNSWHTDSSEDIYINSSTGKLTFPDEYSSMWETSPFHTIDSTVGWNAALLSKTEFVSAPSYTNGMIYRCDYDNPASYWEIKGLPSTNDHLGEYLYYSTTGVQWEGAVSMLGGKTGVITLGTGLSMTSEKQLNLNPPTANGTYKLQCVVTNGVPTISWVSAT